MTQRRKKDRESLTPKNGVIKKYSVIENFIKSKYAKVKCIEYLIPNTNVPIFVLDHDDSK